MLSPSTGRFASTTSSPPPKPETRQTAACGSPGTTNLSSEEDLHSGGVYRKPDNGPERVSVGKKVVPSRLLVSPCFSPLFVGLTPRSTLRRQKVDTYGDSDCFS